MAIKSTGFIGRRVRLGDNIDGTLVGRREAGEVAYARVREGEVVLTIILDSGLVVEHSATSNLIRFGDVSAYEVTAEVSFPRSTEPEKRFPQVAVVLAGTPEEARKVFVRWADSCKVEHIARVINVSKNR